jgi:peptidoglycan-associated lipoprotein
MIRYFTILTGLILAVSCSYTIQIKDGESAFEKKQYHRAIPMLKEEFERSGVKSVKARKAFFIAESYALSDDHQSALNWYQAAYENDFGVRALEKYAQTLKRVEQYDNAIRVFEALLDQEGESLEYRAEIIACRQAKQWREESTPVFTVRSLDFNTAASEYSASFYENQQLVFTSDRSIQSDEEIYAWTGRSFSDLFVVDPAVNVVTPFDNLINTDHNEGTAAFTTDWNTMFFTRCFSNDLSDAYCKLMLSRKRNGRWLDPEVMPFVQDGINYMHPAVSPDGMTLIFASDDPQGSGGFDLWMTQYSEESWSEPQGLGDRINSGSDEKFPFLWNDTLYFASDRVGGMGGLDIYTAYVRPDGSWSAPQNLLPPINSGADDFALIFDPYFKPTTGVLQRGYFTSSRDGGTGYDDIFLFEKIVVAPEMVSEEEPEAEVEEEPELDFLVYLAVVVSEEVHQDLNDPNSQVIGRQPIGNARIEVTIDDSSHYLLTDNRGLALLQIEPQADYRIHAGKPGYLAESRLGSASDLEIVPDKKAYTINEDVILDKIFRGKEIILEDIYYEFDEWYITEEAKPALDRLVKILQDNPNISIELGSHTDCQGEDDYNDQLSQRRAQSAVDYLVSRGIDVSRLNAVGFGESRLRINCPCEECTEEQHQENRRTTFRIVRS